MTRRLGAAVLALGVFAAIVGTASACTVTNLGAPLTTKADLATRPTSATIVARYEEMQLRIRDALDAELGPRGWRQASPLTWAGCGHDAVPSVDGRMVWLALWDFDGPVTAAQWPRATAIIESVIAEYGFRSGGLALNGAGESDTRLMNAFDPELGAHFEFGTKLATTMQVTTGCHPVGPGE